MLIYRCSSSFADSQPHIIENVDGENSSWFGSGQTKGFSVKCVIVNLPDKPVPSHLIKQLHQRRPYIHITTSPSHNPWFSRISLSFLPTVPNPSYYLTSRPFQPVSEQNFSLLPQFTHSPFHLPFTLSFPSSQYYLTRDFSFLLQWFYCLFPYLGLLRHLTDLSLLLPPQCQAITVIALAAQSTFHIQHLSFATDTSKTRILALSKFAVVTNRNTRNAFTVSLPTTRMEASMAPLPPPETASTLSLILSKPLCFRTVLTPVLPSFRPLPQKMDHWHFIDGSSIYGVLCLTYSFPWPRPYIIPVCTLLTQPIHRLPRLWSPIPTPSLYPPFSWILIILVYLRLHGIQSLPLLWLPHLRWTRMLPTSTPSTSREPPLVALTNYHHPYLMSKPPPCIPWPSNSVMFRPAWHVHLLCGLPQWQPALVPISMSSIRGPHHSLFTWWYPSFHITQNSTSFGATLQHYPNPPYLTSPSCRPDLYPKLCAVSLLLSSDSNAWPVRFSFYYFLGVLPPAF